MDDEKLQRALRVELYERSQLNAVRKKSGCLFFHGSTDKNGNTRFKYKGKLYVPHRVVLEFILDRKLGRAEDARQTCGNRQCVEVDHLKLTTRQQTVIEAVAAGVITPPTVNPDAVARSNRERVQDYDADERARLRQVRVLRDERDEKIEVLRKQIEAVRNEYRIRIRKVARGLFDREG